MLAASLLEFLVIDHHNLTVDRQLLLLRLSYWLGQRSRLGAAEADDNLGACLFQFPLEKIHALLCLLQLALRFLQ